VSDAVPTAIDGLLAEIAAGVWFAACGETLTAGERHEIRRLAAALGFAAVPIVALDAWQAAAQVAQRPDWSREWWEREAAEAARLRTFATAALGADPLMTGLSRIALAASSLVGAAALSLARGGIADEALERVAAGAAAHACHQAGLAREAAQPADHVFAVKFRLYAAGRWPLGIVGGQFFVL